MTFSDARSTVHAIAQALVVGRIVTNAIDATPDGIRPTVSRSAGGTLSAPSNRAAAENFV
jgi:hypothetical protein